MKLVNPIWRRVRGAAVLWVATMVLSAVAADACIQNPPPPGPAPCRSLPLPSDPNVPDPRFIDGMSEVDAFPYARVTTEPICVGDPGRPTTWSERDYGRPADVKLARRAYFQRPRHTEGRVLPLIIWTHPNGGSDVIDEPIYAKLAEPALRNGFAFLSLEFRHPTASRPYESPKPAPIPQDHDGESPSAFCAYDSTDIAVAVQWTRLHAPQLMIDRDNIFLVGQSRGSLALLTGLMPDQRDPEKDPRTDYRAWSSKPGAIFIANGQVTYRHEQIEQRFLRRLATLDESYGDTKDGVSRPGIFDKLLQFPLCRNAGSPPRFDYACNYDKSDIVINPRPQNPLSALDELDADDPPVWARYDRVPPSSSRIVRLAGHVADGGEDPTTARPENCYARTAEGCLDVHHPNFGLALHLAYSALAPVPGRRAFVGVQYAATAGLADEALAGENFFRDYSCFFIKYKPAGATRWVKNITADGEARRLAAMQAYADGRQAGEPAATPPSSCGLDERRPWHWQGGAN